MVPSFWIDGRTPAPVVARVLRTAAFGGFPNQYLVVKNRADGGLSTIVMDARIVLFEALPREMQVLQVEMNAPNEVLRRYDRELRSCFVQASERAEPQDRGAWLKIRYTVGDDGRVGNVSVECPPGLDPAVAACVAKVLAPLRLPVPSKEFRTRDHVIRLNPDWRRR